MTSAASVPVTAAPSGASGKLKLVAVTLAIVAVAELVGPVQFSVGPGKVALLPMLWALLIGTTVIFLPAIFSTETVPHQPSRLSCSANGKKSVCQDESSSTS